MPAPSERPDPAKLSGPRMPADHGLTSLGLLMQLGGAVFGGVFAFSALILFLSDAPADLVLEPAFILALSAVRSGFHYRAGRALVHGPPVDSVDRPLSGVARYVRVAFVHTAVCGLILYHEHGLATLTLIAIWVSWPLAVSVLMRAPHIRAMSERIPRAEDLALEGASMYMLLFGIIGAMIAALIMHGLIDTVEFVASFNVVVMYVIVGLLLYRSLLHARAGRIGITGDLQLAAEHTRTYIRFSVASTGVIVVLLGLGAGMDAIEFASIAFLCAVGCLLLCWPLVISRFMDQRLVDTYAARGQLVERRAPDMGLTALGWLLLALSLHGLATTLPTLLLEDDKRRLLPSELLFTPSLAVTFGRSIWISIVIHAVQFWAALELIRMLDGYKIPVTLYGLVGTGLTLYIIWPFFGDGRLLQYLFDTQTLGVGVTVMGEIGISLAIPLTVLVMVRRQPPAQARARFRAREAE